MVAMLLMLLWLLLLPDHVEPQTTVRDVLCPRLYLHIHTDQLAVKALEGVFHIQVEDYNRFPVYQREGGGNIYMKHLESSRGSFLAVTQDEGYFIYATTRYNAVSWREWYDPDRPTRPLDDLLDQWFYYTAKHDENLRLPSDSTNSAASLECVDDEFHPCSSRSFYFSQPITVSGGHNGADERTVVSVPGQTLFTPVPGVNSFGRPLFRSSSPSRVVYIYYRDETWWVGADYSTTSPHTTYMKCAHSGLRLEYLGHCWQVLQAGIYTHQPDLVVQCHGATLSQGEACSANVTSDDVTSTDVTSPCGGAGCGMNTLDQAVCHCTKDRYGNRCQADRPICPQIENVYRVVGATLYLDDVVGVVCEAQTGPAAFLALCVNRDDGPGWLTERLCDEHTYPQFESTSATPAYTTTIYTTTKKPSVFNLDAIWLLSIVVSLVLLLHIITPIIMCCVRDKQITPYNKIVRDKLSDIRSAKTKEKLRKKQLQELEAEIEVEEANLRAGRKTVRKDTENKEKLSAAEEKYRKYIEEERAKDPIKFLKERREWNLERKVEIPEADNTLKEKELLFTVVLSIFCFVIFWLWFAYLAGCTITECSRQGLTLYALYIIGWIILPIAWIYMLIESNFSREHQYVKRLGSEEVAENLARNLRVERPVITFSARAWHEQKVTMKRQYQMPDGEWRWEDDERSNQVTTRTIDERFNYNYVTDHSDQLLTGIRSHGVTKIHMTLSVEPGDDDTQALYDAQWKRFEEDNEDLDDNVDFGLDNQLPSFHKRVATFRDKSSVPCWMNVTVYWVMAIIGLTWLFRIAFRCNVSSTTFNVVKKVYMTRPPDEECCSSRVPEYKVYRPPVSETNEPIERDESSVVDLVDHDITRPAVTAMRAGTPGRLSL